MVSRPLPMDGPSRPSRNRTQLTAKPGQHLYRTSSCCQVEGSRVTRSDVTGPTKSRGCDFALHRFVDNDVEVQVVIIKAGLHFHSHLKLRPTNSQLLNRQQPLAKRYIHYNDSHCRFQCTPLQGIRSFQAVCSRTSFDACSM